MTDTEPPSDADVAARLPHLPVDRDTAEHYRAYLRRALVLHCCADCHRWHHPMRPMCPACWSWNVAPTPVSGRGTVHLVTLLRQGPPANGVDYARSPHPVVTVELAEQPGLRFTSTIVGCKPEDVRIGMPVELTWIERNGSLYPAFRPAAGALASQARSASRTPPASSAPPPGQAPPASPGLPASQAPAASPAPPASPDPTRKPTGGAA